MFVTLASFIGLFPRYKRPFSKTLPVSGAALLKEVQVTALSLRGIQNEGFSAEHDRLFYSACDR